jgi:hypothetical protein
MGQRAHFLFVMGIGLGGCFNATYELAGNNNADLSTTGVADLALAAAPEEPDLSLVADLAPRVVPDGGEISLQVLSPVALGTAIVLDDKKLPVHFAVNNFALEKAGSCPPGWNDCGHVHIKVDGDACNNVAGGKAYNNSGYLSPLPVDLALCPQGSLYGPHTMTVYLENNYHQAVLDQKGQPIAVSFAFNVSAPPTITITAPTAGQTVTRSAANTIDVSFTVTNFLLKAAGTCPAGNDACGHVHLKVDGDSCNNVPAGKAYNNSGAVSPLPANLALCPTATGPHSLLLYLESDTHKPIVGSNGYPISSTLVFTAN